MNYVIAAYGITAASLLGYGFALMRERARRRAADSARQSDSS